MQVRHRDHLICVRSRIATPQHHARVVREPCAIPVGVNLVSRMQANVEYKRNATLLQKFGYELCKPVGRNALRGEGKHWLVRIGDELALAQRPGRLDHGSADWTNSFQPSNRG